MPPPVAPPPVVESPVDEDACAAEGADTIWVALRSPPEPSVCDWFCEPIVVPECVPKPPLVIRLRMPEIVLIVSMVSSILEGCAPELAR